MTSYLTCNFFTFHKFKSALCCHKTVTINSSPGSSTVLSFFPLQSNTHFHLIMSLQHQLYPIHFAGSLTIIYQLHP